MTTKRSLLFQAGQFHDISKEIVDTVNFQDLQLRIKEGLLCLHLCQKLLNDLTVNAPIDEIRRLKRAARATKAT